MIAYLIDAVMGLIINWVSDPIKQRLFPRWAKPAPALPDLGPNVAGPSRLFFGRQQFLAEIAAALDRHHRVALYGPGGVGKTQAALHYREDPAYRDRYSRIFWLPAEQPGVLAQEFARLAVELGLSVPDGDLGEATRRVKQWLDQSSGWLIIFDNVGEPKEIERYLSGGPGHTLITSQNPTWNEAAEPLEVRPLSIADAAEFLVVRGRLADGAGARELAEELGALPLALEQAGAYMEWHKITPVDYLRRYQREELLAIGKPLGYSHTVATTWRMALRQVSRQSALAVGLLQMGAFLAAEQIPVAFLLKSLRVRPAERELDRALGLLSRYSLIRLGPGSFEMHRLFQMAVREGLTRWGRRRRLKRLLREQNSLFPFDEYDSSTWAPAGANLPHAVVLARHGMEAGLLEGADLLNWVGAYLYISGALEQARGVLSEALAAVEKGGSGERHHQALILGSLGSVLNDLGRWEEARAHHQRALAIKERLYGKEDQEVARTLNNLGNVLRRIGQREEAREHYERALAIEKRVYGKEHQEVAVTLNNLGNLLTEMGQWEEAREHYDRALATQERLYGKEHHEVAQTLHNLGTLLADMGQMEEAGAHYDRALVIQERLYGKEYHGVALTLNNLGTLLAEMGQQEEARAHLERALTIYEKRLPPDHPSRLMTLRNLIELLQAMGDSEGAARYQALLDQAAPE